MDKKSSFRRTRIFWRYLPDLNRGMRVLQTLALPLGQGTIIKTGTPSVPILFDWSGWRGSLAFCLCKINVSLRLAVASNSPQDCYIITFEPIDWKKNWSGWRGSNSLPPPWQGGALPDELHPHLDSRLEAICEPLSWTQTKWCLRSESNQRHVDFQSTALPTELQRHIEQSVRSAHMFNWRPGTDSNRRPPAWQAGVLTDCTTGPNMVGTTGLEPVTSCL